MIFFLMRNKTIGLANNIISNGSQFASITPDIVQIVVDPSNDVMVSGEGVKSMSRMNTKSNTKYAKFATYKL